MCRNNYFRRIVPFFASFLIGVFIASFFVTVGRPTFGGRRAKHIQHDRQVRIEMERLREENSRLRQQLDDHSFTVGHDLDEFGVQGLVPPPPPIPTKPARHSIR